MQFKEVKISDKDLINKLIAIEEEVFGVNGGADAWLIKAFVRYGMIIIIMEGEDVVSVAEYMQVMNKNELFLYGFLTREKYRNKGYGTKLIEHSEIRAKEIGMKRISLTVDPNNNVGVNMYKKRGYEVLEFQKDEYGVGIDRYLMSKEIK